MKIAVCLRIAPDGTVSPFEEAAYEAALRMADAEVFLLSMGPLSCRDTLEALSRLGAAQAYLLCDPAFAGSDTLATARVLAAAVRRLSPDLVFCGRKTLMGDTGQVGAMLSVLAGFSYLPGVMAVPEIREGALFAETREGERKTSLPAVLSFERAFVLRFPRLGSRRAEARILSCEDLALDPALTGLAGSPTRVLDATEPPQGKRKCVFLPPEKLPETIRGAALRERAAFAPAPCEKKLPLVVSVGEKALVYARAAGEKVILLPEDTDLPAEIRRLDPDAVLFAGDTRGRALSALTAARMDLGLCADCTSLESDGNTLVLIRPARAGSVLAKVVCLTRPAMASVRTEDAGGERIVAVGYGAVKALPRIQSFASSIGAEICASRKAVDAGILPYEAQVGLTGKTVSPRLYLAVGISGAVQHLSGMSRSGCVIAVNPDPAAPIFSFADYGFVMRAEDLPV